MLCSFIRRLRPISGCIYSASTPLGLQTSPVEQQVTLSTPNNLYVSAILPKRTCSVSKVLSDEAAVVDEAEIEGLSSGGMFIPSEETMDSLVGGVPYQELPIAYVRCSPNNTIISIYDFKSKVRYSYCSAGIEGYKNAMKRSEVAAQETGLTAGLRAKKKGVGHIRVLVKGLGKGRLSAIKGLKMAGLNIVSLTDNTPIYNLGPRPRKARRI